MKKVTISVWALLVTLIGLGQNTFPTTSGTFAGIGTTTPATALHIFKNSTTLSTANFITIDNRGSNASYSTTHIIGGLLFAGWRDVRNPANVAGIWAVRTSSSGGLNSQGDIVFGTTDVNAGNIASDNSLPTERMRITSTGLAGIGTATPNAVLDVATPISAGALGTVLARQVEGNATGDGTYLGTTAWGTQVANYNGKAFSIEHHFYGSKNSAINFYRGGNATGGFITFETNNGSEQMRIDQNGNLGIGTTTPQAKLDINGAARSTGLISNVSGVTDNFTHNGLSFNNYGITWVSDSWQSGGPTAWLSSWGGMKFFTQGGSGLCITMAGNVLIGKTTQVNTAYLLDVNGPVRANQVTVNTTGADFVFEPGYKLAPLNQVQAFIQANHHLPGIEPAAQMQKDGLDVGDNRTKLLQKIEELTLYVIEENKKNSELSKTVEAQSKLLQQQQALLQQLQMEMEKLKKEKP